MHGIPTMPVLCCAYSTKSAVLNRPKPGQAICKECFFEAFESEMHQTIHTNKERKDSMVLSYVLKTLNERHHYGADLVLLSVDEGITDCGDCEKKPAAVWVTTKDRFPQRAVWEDHGCHSAKDWV